MLLADLAVASLVAVVLSALFVVVFRWDRPGAEGPWAAFVFIFTLLFVVTWGLGTWVSPAGPAFGGAHWLAFLVVGFLAALLVGAVRPGRRARTRLGKIAQAEDEETAVRAFGVFSWALLVVAVLIGVLRHAGKI